MRRLLWAAGAVAASALLLRYGGMGLHPIPGLLLLAPLPVLLLAPRVNAPTAAGAAFLAWLLGGIHLWSYYTATLEQPVPVAVGLVGGSALVFAGLVALMRALLRRGWYVAGALVVPAGWVALEYVVTLATPFGTWWSIAYTQADARALLQVSALTGHWGVTFVALGVPAAIAAVAAPGAARRIRVRLGVATLLVAALVMGYGAWVSTASQAGPYVRVAALAVTQPPEYLPVDTPAGRTLVAGLVREIGRLADAGAEVVVLPEKSLRANEKTLPLLTGPLTRVARERGIHVVAGLVLTRNGTSVNAAMDLPSGAVYAKHLLIPGLEDDLQHGDRRVLVPGRPRWALAVCFDLEKADLVRAYRRDGAQLLLVPALDFEKDAWLHSRMAVTRGVEYGLGVVRAAQLGSLTVSDSTGRVLAERHASVTSTASVVADLPADPAPTPYSWFGDWFAWLSIALLLAGSAAMAAGRPSRVERGAEVDSELLVGDPQHAGARQL